jgi:hypothetical protein
MKVKRVAGRSQCDSKSLSCQKRRGRRKSNERVRIGAIKKVRSRTVQIVAQAVDQQTTEHHAIHPRSRGADRPTYRCWLDATRVKEAGGLTNGVDKR